MVAVVDARFQKKIEVAVSAYSPAATTALNVMHKVLLFVATTGFFGILVASNFVKVPKWANYGVGVGGTLGITLISLYLNSVAQARERKQKARLDALDMTSTNPLAECQLPATDSRFVTQKLQADSGQKAPPGLEDWHELSGRMGVDVPVATRAQRVNELDRPIDCAGDVFANKMQKLMQGKIVEYRTTFQGLAGRTAGPLFEEVGCKAPQLRPKVDSPFEWEKDLPIYKRFLVENWRKAKGLYELVTGKAYDYHLTVSQEEVADPEWIQAFQLKLNELRVEIERLDQEAFKRRLKERLATVKADVIKLRPTLDVKGVSEWLAEDPNEVLALQQAIARGLGLRREFFSRSKHDPNPAQTAFELKLENQKAAIENGLHAMELELKRQLLREEIVAITAEPSKEKRLELYKAFYKKIKGQQIDGGVLFIRRSLDQLDLGTVELESLENAVTKKRSIAALCQRMGIEEVHSLSTLLQSVKDLLSAIADEKSLADFLNKVHKPLKGYVMFRGKSRISLAFEKTILPIPWDLKLVEEEQALLKKPIDDRVSALGFKKKRQAHHERLMRQDITTYKADRYSEMIIILLSTALTVAAVATTYLKHRYASIALNSAAMLTAVGSLFGRPAYINSRLRRKRTLLLQEHLLMHPGKRVLGRTAQEVQARVDALGVEGDNAVAFAMVHNAQTTIGVADRLRGKFMQSSGQKRAAAFAKEAWWQKKKGETPVLDLMRMQLAKGEKEAARYLTPHAEDAKKAKELMKTSADHKKEQQPVCLHIEQLLSQKRWKMAAAFLPYAEGNVKRYEEALRNKSWGE